MMSVGDHYHPIGPSHNLDESLIKLCGGLTIISLLIALAFIVQKYRYKSIKVKKILFISSIILLAWIFYLFISYKPDTSKYDRTYAGQKYSIPWNKVSGTLTMRGNSLTQWSEIKSIGFYYCHKQSNDVQNECHEVATKKAKDEVDFASWDARHNSNKEPISLLENLKSAEAQTTDILIDMSDILVFRNLENNNDNEYYLFDKNSNETNYHWAFCREKNYNAVKIKGKYYCQHYIRQGDDAWAFELRMNQSKNYKKHLDKIKDQLKSYQNNN